MKKTISLGAISLAASVGLASGQGLLSIGQGTGGDDFESRLPFKTTLSMDVGWDDNARSAPSGDEEDSAYIRGGVNVQYGGFGSRRTKVDLTAGFSTIYYFEQVDEEVDDTFYSARLGLNIHHKVNRRLTLGNNTYFSYEIEPDNAIGSSASRRLDQYLYGYNSVWASYSWSRRFSTVSRYTLSGVDYEEGDVGLGEDRLTHTFSQEARYVLNRLTTLVGEYRYSTTDYSSVARDYDSHYFLAGLDHSFSRDLHGTIRVGGERRQSDNRGDEWRPYGEASLRYALGKRSNLHWYGRVGLEDSELGFSNFDRRYTYRTGLTLNHSFTERLRGNAGVTYIHSDFEGGGVGDTNEDLVSLSLGVSYRIFSNVDLNARYHFTDLSSGTPGRDFDRNRVSAGLSVTF